MRAIRIAALLYAATAAGVFACAGQITYLAITPDAGDDGAPTTGDNANIAGDGAAGADALAQNAPDGAVYVPDPTAQSAAFQINASHTGSTEDPSLFGVVSRRWEKAFPGRLAFPLIAHDKVIVTFITADKHGALQAFDSLSGASVWGPIDLGVSTGSSSAYDGGRVFALNRSGTLRAFDVDTGAPLWTTELGLPATPMQFLAAPTAYRGRVHVLPNNFGQAMAVNEITGALVWKAAQWGGYASPAVTDTAVFVSVGCKHVYRLGPATGAVAWEATSNCSSSSGTPVVVDGTLFASSGGGGVYFLDIATGVWSTKATVGTLAPAIHGGTAFLPFNGLVFGRSVFGGSVSWQYDPPDGTPFVAASAMVAGGHVHVLWDDCTLRALEPTTGALLWSDSEPSACADGPSVSSEGGPVALAAAAGIIAVPYRTHLVVYGVGSTNDGGTDAGSD